MASLATVALECAKKLGRANADGTAILDLEDEIYDEIGNAIRQLNRRPWHFTETRALTITTVPGQTWYSSASSGSRTVSVSDILSIDYLRENASSLSDRLRFIRYSDFECMSDGPALPGLPRGYTRYGEQIGLYPTPSEEITLTLTATVKPIVPEAGSDTSVWFDQARELIVSSALARIYLTYLRDPEGAARYQPIIDGTETALHSEFVRKSASGRIKSHD